MAPETRSTSSIFGLQNANQTFEMTLSGSSSGQPNPNYGNAEKSVDKPKKKRGPTAMHKIWAREDEPLLTMEFNTLGQPIGENKIPLVHFLGTIARNGKYAPVNYESWSRMPELYKTDIVNLVKRKFDIPLGKERWILRSMGKKWRNWKSILKSKYFKPSLSFEAQVKIVPPRVHPNQWEGLLKIWYSGNAQKLSDKNKVSRGKQKMIPRTGKKSFAEIAAEKKKELGHSPSRVKLFRDCYVKEDKKKGTVSASKASLEALARMEELEKQNPDVDDSTSKSDIFSQVMGKERNGHLRMYGLGVCPSDIWGEVPSRTASYRMAMEFKSDLDKVSGQYKEMSSQMQQMMSYFQSEGHNFRSCTSPNANTPSRQPIISSSTSSARRSIRVNAVVGLKSILNPTEIVAKGVVNSMDSTTKVGGMELGENWCEVNVQVPIKWDEQLIRPYDLFQVVGDAIGAPIAWPLSLVELDDEF